MLPTARKEVATGEGRSSKAFYAFPKMIRLQVVAYANMARGPRCSVRRRDVRRRRVLRRHRNLRGKGEEWTTVPAAAESGIILIFHVPARNLGVFHNDINAQSVCGVDLVIFVALAFIHLGESAQYEITITTLKSWLTFRNCG